MVNEKSKDMEPQYETPMALVEALQQRGLGARTQLWGWLASRSSG